MAKQVCFSKWDCMFLRDFFENKVKESEKKFESLKIEKPDFAEDEQTKFVFNNAIGVYNKHKEQFSELYKIAKKNGTGEICIDIPE